MYVLLPATAVSCVCVAARWCSCWNRVLRPGTELTLTVSLALCVHDTKGNHLTNFAVLTSGAELGTTSTSASAQAHQDNLSLISTIGCVVSIVALAITLWTFLFFYVSTATWR